MEPVAGSLRNVTRMSVGTSKGLLMPLQITSSPLNSANEAKTVPDQPDGAPGREPAKSSFHISITLPLPSTDTIIPFVPTAIMKPLKYAILAMLLILPLRSANLRVPGRTSLEPSGATCMLRCILENLDDRFRSLSTTFHPPVKSRMVKSLSSCLLR